MRLPRRRRLLLAALALLLFPLGAGLAVALDGARDEEPDPRGDLAVVLGNKVHPDGRPSQLLRHRLERALALWQRGAVREVMVSGALGKEGHDEAVVMRDWLVARGVPRERVIVDSQGWTTFHTARNARAVVRERGLASVVVVTSYYHVPRARLALERAGVANVKTAHAVVRLSPKDPGRIARELLGIAWYAVRDPEAPLGPG